VCCAGCQCSGWSSTTSCCCVWCCKTTITAPQAPLCRTTPSLAPLQTTSTVTFFVWPKLSRCFKLTAEACKLPNPVVRGVRVSRLWQDEWLFWTDAIGVGVFSAAGASIGAQSDSTTDAVIYYGHQGRIDVLLSADGLSAAGSAICAMSTATCVPGPTSSTHACLPAHLSPSLSLSAPSAGGSARARTRRARCYGPTPCRPRAGLARVGVRLRVRMRVRGRDVAGGHRADHV